MTTKSKTDEKIMDAAPDDGEAVTTTADTTQTDAAADTAPEGAAADNLARLRRQKETRIVVACPMSQEQAALQQELKARSERLRSQKIDTHDDNELAITAAARKLTLDARMLSPEAQDHPGSKINTLVDNVYAIWQRTEPIAGTQLIFADLGVKPTPWGFSAYDEIIDKLATRGIPRQQIAAIGDADSQAKRRELFDRLRSGQVRVLLGSTHTMGAATTAPKRLVALHHLDCPFMPSDIEKRQGRILPQGNENEQAAIYRYVTEKSLDALRTAEGKKCKAPKPAVIFTLALGRERVQVEYRPGFLPNDDTALVYFFSPYDPPQPHPLSDTGYFSRFVPHAAVEACGGPQAYAALLAEAILRGEEQALIEAFEGPLSVTDPRCRREENRPAAQPGGFTERVIAGEEKSQSSGQGILF